jgi:NH3-dependent NAD+ synthetase
MGFWTLHGDVGDYGMIQNLWKTEVYGVAKWLADVYEEHCEATFRADALRACVDATPTDGLGISNSDLDQLGASSYNEVDKIIIDYLINGQHCEESWEHPVIKRYERTHFKRENPINLTREELLP